MTRIVSNNNENIPMGLFMIWGACLCVDDELQCYYCGLCAGYVLCRLAWTYSYVKALMPARTIAFLLG